MYQQLFGGVTILTRAQFTAINGYSNRFFGWGGEDDDLYNRVRARGYRISRPPMTIARYKMLSHKKDKPNPMRIKILKEGRKRFAWDGLNSLRYRVVRSEEGQLFTRIVVSIDQAEVMSLDAKSALRKTSND